MLGFILNDPASEITATVLCGYGAYLMAEVLGASGVLSMVSSLVGESMHATHSNYVPTPTVPSINRPPLPSITPQVAAGLYLSFHGLGRISARVTGSLKSFWSMADYIANTVRPSPLSLPFGLHGVLCF